MWAHLREGICIVEGESWVVVARKCLREGRSHQQSAACSRKRETITTGHDVGTGCGRTERFSVSCQLLQAEKRKRKEELSELQSKQDALAQCEAQIKEIIHDPFQFYDDWRISKFLSTWFSMGIFTSLDQQVYGRNWEFEDSGECPAM